jgi:hypothetical protein
MEKFQNAAHRRDREHNDPEQSGPLLALRAHFHQRDSQQTFKRLVGKKC